MSEMHKAGDEADVLAVAEWALANSAAMEILGAGSKRGLGRPLDVAHQLDLSGLTGITLYEPDELVLRARAGTAVREIEDLLAENRQQLGFEPADYGRLFGGAADRQTIGGMLATNQAGPRRIKAGAARDHFLGLKCVNGRAEAIKSGGRVVKNVTGYDLCKLLAGSHGTLAALTEVTVKVLPMAERCRTVLIGGLDPDAAIVALARAMGGVHEVSGAAYLPAEIAARSAVAYVSGAGASITALRVEGTKISADYRSNALRDDFADMGGIEELHSANTIRFWREVRDVAALLPAPEKDLWRLSVTPGAAAGIAGAIGGEAYFDWAGGLIWIALPASDDAASGLVREAVGQAGHATLIRAEARVRSRVEPFQPQPAPLAQLSARVKESFDPKKIFNPGRMYRGV